MGVFCVVVVGQTEPDGEQCGDNTGGTAFRQYGFNYDLAGNRTQEVVTVDGTPTTANYAYNTANQISNTGFAYDDAGRMTSDGTNTYVWDRANRLLSMGGIAYAYDGLGNRVSQTANSVVTSYLNDVQPGLTKVLAQTVGSDVTRFVHGPRGIQGVEDRVGAWTFPVQDGLGSVRDDALSYSPYGVPDDTITGFAFTGEMCDANGLQYHRARYYAPELGVFPSVDPFEGVIQRAMSLNRYSWVEGNPVNSNDFSGLRPCQGSNCSECLDKIENRLSGFKNELVLAAVGLGLVGIVNDSALEAARGFAMTARLMGHYLRGSGEQFIVEPSDLSSDMHNAIVLRMANVLLSGYLSDICSRSHVDEVRDFVDIGLGSSGQPTTLVRGDNFVDNPWWLDSIEGLGIDVSELHPGSSSTRIWKPHYIAFGGFTITQPELAEIATGWAPAWGSSDQAWYSQMDAVIDFYDHYDWCFGNEPCNACGTHPAGMRVGHFAALELAGRAKQFEIFGRWGVRLNMKITCGSGVPDMDWTYSLFSVPVPSAFISRPSYTKDMRYTYEGGEVIDDWSSCSAGDFADGC